ncbi:MAG: NHLP bacteriocin export ABC transporter permease/ATPase subunit [Planctomycetes bacterium]|nr:NHLP bacteriocin export ABC transporter permease/ATPase subunit [Planctomycetota bacterium]MBI3844233.1 NHLP bacteriocin export ABC transporter permease/ATPase subunit [Planctomycetota bacterium]
MTSHSHEARVLRGNEVLSLDDPDGVWVVESGRVALFALFRREGSEHGPRRFLFSSGPGEALLGFPRGGDRKQPAIIAVALEEARIRRLPRSSSEGPDGAARTPAELTECWVAKWTACVAIIGNVRPPPGGALIEFHSAVLDRLREFDARTTDEDGARLRERERRFGEVVQQAIDGLTSVLGPRGDVTHRGSDLFVAASTVGHALGITMRRPAAWEETRALSDPVETIARASHVRTRKVNLDGKWWNQDCGPLLGFAGAERRPVALLPNPAGGYVVFDPSNRSRVRADAMVASSIQSQAYAFYRPLPENATRAPDLIRFALRGRGRDLLVVLATACGATLLGMFTPLATALLVDHALPDSDLGLLTQIGLGLLAAAFGIAVFRWSQGIAMLRLETGADSVTQSAVWDRLLNLQLSFFRQFSTGDLESRVTAVSQMRSYLGGTTLRTLFSGVVLLLNLGLLLYYSPTMTLLAVVVAILCAAATVISGVVVLRCARSVLDLKGRFFGLMVQLVNGIAKLRVAAAEERAFSRWARDYAQLLQLELRQTRAQDAVQVINVAISTLGTVVLFMIGASLLDPQQGTRELTTGVFLGFTVAYGSFIGAVVGVSNTVTDVMAIAILSERARPILEATPEIDDRKADPGELEGKMQLDRVVFQYTNDGPVILNGLSLSVDQRQFAAIVGPSGSGKSTLLRLLLGFETPQSGTIYYDGQDLAGLDVHAVRRQLGVVLQAGRINSGSIFENIVTGTQVTLNDAWEAARAAGFADDVSEMPMGMHTIVSEGGTNLSGGQRQRLLIARALVHKPKILFLDEATSALDNRTQAVVSESLEKLDVTRVVIAHRLSTVRNADRIFVVEAGRVVQSGTFSELAEQEGLFARLMARQLT